MFASEEEKGRKQNGGNTRDAQLQLCSVSLGVSCHPPALSPRVRERQQALFTGNPDDHGTEGNARYSERQFGRQLPPPPGLLLFPAQQKRAVKCQFGKCCWVSVCSSSSWGLVQSHPFCQRVPLLSIGVIISIDLQIIASPNSSVSQRS